MFLKKIDTFLKILCIHKFTTLFHKKNIPAASAAEVASQNVVGYQKIDLANGFTMIGTSFQSVGVENSLHIQDIKASGLTGFDWSFATSAGDTIQIWDASAQGYLTTLFYTGDEYDEFGMMQMYGAEPGTWFDMNAGGPANIEIPAGGAFWIQSSGNGTLTFK
jgi:hypothetical protein